jgi:hypothetical protein
VVDVNDSRWWPSFERGTCSVCGAIVGARDVDRGQHQLWHGLIWRLLVGDPHPINEQAENDLRAWLRAVDRD